MWRDMIIGAVCGAAVVSASAAVAETYVPLRAEAVRQSVGVNTHIRYTDGAYRRIADVIRALDYLDIRHVRDSVPRVALGRPLPLAEYIWLNKAGVRFNLIIGGGVYHPADPIIGLEKLEAARPGAIESIEGFNEVNNEPVTYNGDTSLEAALAAHAATVSLLRTHPTLGHIPILDLTGNDIPNTLGDRGDYHNTHVYAQNGNQPGGWMGKKNLWADGKPWVITEFGYASNPQSGWLVIGVGEAEQAKGILNGILDAAQYGVSRIYLYELLDEKPDPEGKSNWLHLGLFTVDSQPKPAAKALRNLLRIIGDPDPAALTFMPQPLDVEIQGAPKTLRVLTIQKASGETGILLWNEIAFWDREHGKPIQNVPVPVKLTLPSGARATALYDPMKQEAAIRQLAGEGELTIEVPDYPVIVEIAR
ncbi:hypothetical protein [Asticcacaulis sp.]|uniref:hypothetical protein n=1 Tax=Asticcacaulis sp. TaxID=1872648 RepID=UPI002B55C85C|nr:hypothetical protein [Asticcacaulis sp.]HTM80358.1 hypothetical protein [Asticcacaulis sp.]